MTADRTFLFSSSDGQQVRIQEKAALLCTVVQDMKKNLELAENSEIKVVDWLNHHQNDHTVNDIDPEDRDATAVPEWDQNFLKVPQTTLFEIILVATYLDIKGLMQYCCKTLAQNFKGKTVEELRENFGLMNDFAPGEEEQIRRENAWCID